MDLSIIIVNLNASDLLLQCLKSIQAANPRCSFEIIVVDNGSSDESIARVENEFPEVILIKNEKNLGFARANNQGLAIGKARYFLLLNSDTVVKAGAFDTLVEAADSHPELGVIGPRLLNLDGTLQKSWSSFPSFLSELLGRNFRIRKPIPDFPQAYEVDWILGACMLVRSEVVREVGMMDPEYFFYSEETDWCYRIKKGNWRIWYLENAEVYHLGGGSTSRGSLGQLVNLYRGKILFFEKHYGPMWATSLRFGLALVNSLGVARRAVFRNWFNPGSSSRRIMDQSRLVWCLLTGRYPKMD